MPTYEYVCKLCGQTLEEFQSMTEPPLTRCPRCGTENLARSIGAGSGVIFKGSGFYLTDYKKSNTTPASGSRNTPEKKNESKPSEAPEAPKKSSATDGSKKRS